MGIRQPAVAPDALLIPTFSGAGAANRRSGARRLKSHLS